MTVYHLIELLTTHCAPDAQLGDVRVWWSEKHKRLYIQRERPGVLVSDAVDVSK